MKKLSKKIQNILMEFGFYESSLKVESDDYSDYVELEQHTPAGEDWCPVIRFNGKTEQTFVEAIVEYAAGFDVDEEVEPYVECRGKRGVPSSIKLLVEDAEWKKETLEKLAQALFAWEFVV